MAIRQNASMRRADFVFCIGYDGSTAVVDGRQQRRHGALDAGGLAAAGLYKQALARAAFDGDDAAGASILEHYNAHTAHPVGTVAELERLYGTTTAPEGVTKVNAV
jgi:hypothetical protein